MNSFTLSTLRNTLLSAFAMSLVLASPALAGTVTQITLGDFTNTQVLDFNSATLGAISGTDPLFTNFGISQVTTTASVFDDTFNNRANSSRALWQNSSGLAIVDPGATNNATFINYTLDFSSLHTNFGVGIHDQGDDFTYTFFNGVTNVGSLTLGSNTFADLFQVYLENDMAFNRVTISNLGGGFALDNITLEGASSAPIPEPSTMLLLGSGLIGLIGYRMRKAQA